MTFIHSKTHNEVYAGIAQVERNAIGIPHHLEKPAIISSERHEWYKNGLPHREGGPAIMNLETKQVDFWNNGKYLNTVDLSNDPDLFDSFLWKDK